MRHRTFYLRCALLTGVLLALAWPGTGGITPLIFIAWVPLLWAEEVFARSPERERPRNFMPYVMLALLVWNGATTWWLFNVSEHLATRLFTLIGPNVGNVLVMSVPWLLFRIVRRSIGGGAARWSLMVFWLAFERFHMHWDLSWPWLTLGNAFAGHTAWVQWYEVTGHLGGTIWVWAANIMVLRVAIRGAKGVKQAITKPALAAVLVVAVPWAGSLLRYATFQERGISAEVVVVQPNIDPYKEKFGAIDPMDQLERMLGQARPLMDSATALVVMPETALQEPTTISNDRGRLVFHGLWENDMRGSRSVARIHDFLQPWPKAAVIAGMSAARLYPPGAEYPVSARVLEGMDRAFDAYNAALLVRADGTVEDYNKSKLVPGVELMPFEKVLGPLGGLAIDLGGTTGSLGTQQDREVIWSGPQPIGAAPIICYESIYGDHVAAHVRNGANLLVIMTNDGWWGNTPGYHQHLLYGKLRAVETRRDVARSANTGISCFIDQRGDMHQTTDWWVPAAIKSEVLLRHDLTFFVLHGDYIGKGAYAATLVLLLVAAGRAVLRRKDPAP
ncbi:MAG TPA: apolipoprotein N-acyltransferase [Flavobacteriales bacterium]|nr:apolipoprotein N-acyltransferase [Flavobacteriales bacterium]HRO39250.1 apolipoprotein N-acyltransferase [Flavobacteriales bacterium]HRP81502.1 apolipoprotein N-acyltransferase [Flavobacteriales bacterium]HRQ84565.1 apolipoprotein N-acyltransferase [Flavobacteriales bacterium]